MHFQSWPIPMGWFEYVTHVGREVSYENFLSSNPEQLDTKSGSWDFCTVLVLVFNKNATKIFKPLCQNPFRIPCRWVGVTQIILLYSFLGLWTAETIWIADSFVTSPSVCSFINFAFVQLTLYRGFHKCLWQPVIHLDAYCSPICHGKTCQVDELDEYLFPVNTGANKRKKAICLSTWQYDIHKSTSLMPHLLSLS